MRCRDGWPLLALWLLAGCGGGGGATLPPPPGVLARVSVGSAGQANDFSFDLAISADGRFVAFASRATNLVPGDANNAADIFVRDACVGAPPGCTPSTVRASVDSTGNEANLPSSVEPALSADGRFLAFTSGADNLVAGDTNFFSDIFVRDSCVGAPPGCAPSTVRVSVDSAGNQADLWSFEPTLNANGRFITFTSAATNLVPGDTNNESDIFVRDTCVGAPPGCTPSTIRASVDSAGNQAVQTGFQPSAPALSADGRFVAFRSDATNLVPGDTNNESDIFVRDTCAGAPAGCTPSTIRASVDTAGNQANAASREPALSGDGRFVAFTSAASNLVPGDTNSAADIFVRDACVGAPAGCTPSTTRVSVDTAGSQANFLSSLPALSANGRFVAFTSAATNLVPGDTNNALDIFVRDTCVGAPVGCTPSTLRASVDTAGGQANDNSFQPAISGDGHFVAFISAASNLVPGDTNNFLDIFLARTGF